MMAAIDIPDFPKATTIQLNSNQIVAIAHNQNLTPDDFLIFDEYGAVTPTQVSVDDFLSNPSSYMKNIRDFDGNDLGKYESWKKIGEVDVQGDGDKEYVFVNPTLGRWATVGANSDNLINFGNHGKGGDTRIVGVYEDPLVKSGKVAKNGPNDSQRRFENDLRIDNLTLIPNSGQDYDRDGYSEIYFRINDGTAVLHALMHKDGNIQYANYQSESDLATFMNQNGVSSSIWSDWL